MMILFNNWITKTKLIISDHYIKILLVLTFSVLIGYISAIADIYFFFIITFLILILLLLFFPNMSVMFYLIITCLISNWFDKIPLLNERLVLSASRLSLIVIFIVILINLLLGRLRISHLKNPISISVTATLLFMIFGGFFAIDQYTFVLKYFSYIFEGVLLYLLFTIVTRKKNYLTESFVGFGIIGVILSFLTIIEAIVGKDLFLNVIEMSSRSGQFRPGGPIGHGLPLAATIAISFFPVFYCFSSAKTKFKKIIYATFLGIQIIAVLFTLSRSVIIGLIFALITFVFIQIYLRGLFKQLFKIFVYLVFISLIILLLIFLIPNVYNAITNIFSIDYLYRDTSIKDRLIVFEWVSYMINNTKGLGVGLGNFPIFVSLYFSPYNLYPDNEFLRILGESGIPGIISFILVLILSIKKLFSTFEKRKDNYSKQISIYLLSSLVCLIICLFGFDLLGFQASAAVFWLILALITNL